MVQKRLKIKSMELQMCSELNLQYEQDVMNPEPRQISVPMGQRKWNSPFQRIGQPFTGMPRIRFS